MKTLLKSFAISSTMAALVLAVPVSALAHTELTSSNPSSEQVVTSALSRIEITFSEPPIAEGNAIAIVDETGSEISLQPAQLDGATLFTDWPAELSEGNYSLNYRVVADDGHVVEGTIPFSFAPDVTPDITSATPMPLIAPAPVANDSQATNTTSWVIALVVGCGIVGAVFARRRN